MELKNTICQMARQGGEVETPSSAKMRYRSLDGRSSVCCLVECFVTSLAIPFAYSVNDKLVPVTLIGFSLFMDARGQQQAQCQA